MYKLKIRKQVVKFINSSVPKERKRIAEAFSELQNNPFQNNLDIKKLKDTHNKYRLRIGVHRFLYSIFQDELLVYIYKADNRGDVYK